MAQTLAVDWDRHEARYVLASINGHRIDVVAAAAVPLVDVAEGGHDPYPDTGGSLRAALADKKVGRTTTLVGVQRAGIELLHFTVPPAGDEELPELVLLQAMRESPLVTENSRLDFVPAGTSSEIPRSVTAAVLASEEFDRIHSTCATAGLTPKRLLIRPYASASLFLRTAPETDQVSLLVNLVAEEIDLTLLVDGEVAYFRTVRLPHASDDDRTADRLLAEIRRTLAVAPEYRLGSDPVERICIFGGPDDHRDLIDRIGEEFSLPATTFNPFEAVGASGDAVPENPGRFASLLGMLLDEALGGEHAIDFLHPRQRPQPPNRRRTIVRIAGLLAVVLLVGGYYAWDTFSDVDARNQLLLQQSRELAAATERADKRRQLATAILQWQVNSVVWLDELRDLSLRFPPARDMVVLRMSMSPSRSGGGSVELDGLVRDPSVVVRMEHNVRDEFHEVRSKRVQERMVEKDYAWHFETSISVARRDKSQYLSHLPDWQVRRQETAPAETKPPEAPPAASQQNEPRRVNGP